MPIFMVAETKKEVLIVKTTIHDIMNQMIRVIELSCLEKATLDACSMFSYLATGNLSM